MTTWADLFDRATAVAVDRESIGETLTRQRTDEDADRGAAGDATTETEDDDA